MSHQVCHCGWSKKTTYQGLRTHQGKMGCTPKGMHIPESEQFSYGYVTYRTPIRVEEPLMDIFTPALKSAGQYTLGNNWQESHQRDIAPFSWTTPVRNENVSANVTTEMAATEAAITELLKSLGQEAQQQSLRTATNSDGTHRALDFTNSSQLMPPLPQIFGPQMNPAPTEVTVKDTNKPLFETPPPYSTTHQTTNNARRALDFSTNEQQVGQQDLPTTAAQETAARSKEREKEKEREAQKLQKNVPVFPNITTATIPTQAAGETFRSFGQMEAQQHSLQTATKSHQAHGFTSSSQLPQIFGPQMNPAPTEVTVKDTNKPLFGTPSAYSTTHQTTNNALRALDFSTNEQQPSLMPRSQIFSAQVNPAAAEVPVKETNKPLFGFPQYNSTTHQTTMNAQAGQLGSEMWGFPKTTSQDTAVRSQEREKEREKEKEKEKEKEREAQKLQKAKQDKMRADLQQKIQTTEQKMVEVTSSAKACKGGLDAEWLEINNAFSEVIRVVEGARQKALQPLEKRRHEVKKEAHYLVQKLQKEIDKLKKTIDELDKNPDLQVSPLTDHKESRDWRNVTFNTSFSFGTLRTSTSDMMEQIQQKLEKLSSVELKRIPTFAVDVKLDPTSAHRNLVLSRDLKTVRDGGKSQEVPDAPQRFDMFGSILGRDRLTSGKSYWEVEVGNKTGWDLGVARGDANRKGKLSLNPDNGYWVTVHYEDKKYAALTEPPVSLSLTGKPQKVGVFVDYEEGLVSFYDVTAQSHIYSFTECSFSGAVFPYFSPHLKQNEKNSYPLIISAVTKQ